MARKRTKVKNDYSGSSDHLKKKLNLSETIDNRLKIFIAIVILFAGVLIYRLYDIQIVNASHYQNLLEKFSSSAITQNTKRGEFVDRNNVSLVSNKTKNQITYFPVKGTAEKTKWNLAYLFAETFDYEYKLTEQEKADLWLYLYEEEKVFFSEEEKLSWKTEKLSALEILRYKRAKVDETMKESLTSLEEEAYKIFMLMMRATNANVIIYDDATHEDIAYIAEHQSMFPGFSYQIDWERAYTDDANLDSIFGSISDIPLEKLDYFLAMGYEMKDKIGSSGLEYQYEDLLSGSKSEYVRDPDTGLTQTKKGVKGYDLKMALDIELQKEVENILTGLLESSKYEKRREYSDQMHAVVTDPNTGDILAIVAIKRRDDGSYYNDPELVLLNSYPVGSTVKPATVYMGLEEGAITPGTTFLDTPMFIKGTPPRRSYANLGLLNDIQAITVSSNIYMFHVAIELGGSKYVPNGPLNFQDPDKTFRTMRNYFSQFGLGVKTMIDYPREEMGYKGKSQNSGLLLEFAIGQYDNYNALQLNQFVTTLANDGYRLKPRMVTEAFDSETNQVVYENAVEILNTVDNKMALGRVKTGMGLCYSRGSCGGFTNLGTSAAGKTGTAQDRIAGVPVKNNTFIAFAPLEKPEVAVACIHPHAYQDNIDTGLDNLCSIASKKIVESYMNLK